MTDELVRGIRRIVGDLDEKPKGIGDAEARKPIGISRGIAYIGRDGGVSSSGGAEGGGNDTSPPDVPQPDTDPDNGAPGDTGGTNDGSTGGGTGEALSGDADAVDQQSKMGSEIGQVTGTDQASGTFSTVNLNTLEGIEYVPPEGWDTPFMSPGEEEGKSFVSGQIVDTYYANASAMGDGILAVDPFVLSVDSFDVAVSSGSVGLWGGTIFFYDRVVTYQVTIPTGSSTRTGYRVDTPSGEENQGGDWPVDGTCQVVYDHSADGYKGNERDQDCSSDQKTAKNFVILRSQSDPSKYFRYTRLADGGTKVTQVDSSGAPVPGSITKTIGPDGRVNGFYDVSLDAGIN